MAPSVSLDQLRLKTRAEIVSIEWQSLDPSEIRRLQNFGFAEGVFVEPLHLGPFGSDPLAVRIGRMTVAIRRAHARAVRVMPIAA